MSDSPLAFLNRASMLVLKGLVQEALALLEQAIQAFPFDPRPPERIAELYKGLGRRADAVRAYLGAAELYAQAGTPLRALELCKKVLELEPNNAKAQRILKAAPPQTVGEESDPGEAPTAPRDADPASGAAVLLEFSEDDASETTSISSLQQEHEEPTPISPTPIPARAGAPPVPAAKVPAPVARVVPGPPPPSVAADDDGTLLADDDLVFDAEDKTTVSAPSFWMPAPARGPSPPAPRPTAFPPPVRPKLPSLSKLPSIPLFAELPPKAFREILGAAQRRSAKAGELIFQEGSQGRSFYIVLAGDVEVWRQLPPPQGRRRIARLGPGEFFGEMALLSLLPRSASVSALQATELYELSGELLARLSAEHKPVEAALHRFYKRRIVENLAVQAPLFRAFHPEEREALVRAFWLREAKVGERLLVEGGHANGFYVLLSAAVELCARGPGGAPVVLQQMRAGGFFGWGSIVEERPSLVTVEVREAGRYLYIPRKTFHDLVRNHASAKAAMAPLLSARRALIERARRGEPITSERIEMP